MKKISILSGSAKNTLHFNAGMNWYNINNKYSYQRQKTLRSLLRDSSLIWIFCISVFICRSSNVFAEDAVKVEKKLYAGIGLGSSSFDKGGTGTGYSISLGYKIQKDLAAELSYINQGKGEEDYTEDDGTKGTESFESKGTMISVLGFIPINEKINFFGRIGFYNWESEYKDEWSGMESYGGDTYKYYRDSDKSDNGTDPVYGIGFKFNLNPNIDFIIEYDAIKLKDFAANMVRGGVSYQF